MFADSRLTINGWYLAVIDLKIVKVENFEPKETAKDLRKIIHQHTLSEFSISHRFEKVPGNNNWRKVQSS